MLHEYNRIRRYWNTTRYNWRETSTMIITLWYFELLKYASIYNNSHVTFWNSNVTDYLVVIILERLQKWWFNVSTQVALK